MSEPHVRLKHGWMSSTRLIRARKRVGDSAPLVWVMAVTYCNENQTDGRIHGDTLETFTSHKEPAKVIASLVESEALEDLGDGYYAVRDFLLHNQSKEQRESLLARRRQAGSRGGSAKQVLSKSQASAKQEPSKSLGLATQLLDGCYDNVLANVQQANVTATATDQEEVQEEDGAVTAGGYAPSPSPDAVEIRRVLREARSLRAIATAEFAEFLAGYCRAGASLALSDVVRAIGEADEKITAQEAASGTLYTSERAASLVSGYVRNARRKPAREPADADREPPPKPTSARLAEVQARLMRESDDRLKGKLPEGGMW